MDVEKTIEFILGMQAQFQSQQLQMQANMDRMQANLDRMQTSLDRLSEENRVIAAAVHRLIQVGQENRDWIIELRRQQEEDRRRSQELREDVLRTTDNLNALIKVVDDMRRNNGH